MPVLNGQITGAHGLTGSSSPVTNAFQALDMACSVTMPNILVGSVGGGTGLPSQSAALNILGLKGAGKGAALAEVAAATCLCGEISIVAAIAAGHFTRAHQSLARQR